MEEIGWRKDKREERREGCAVVRGGRGEGVGEGGKGGEGGEGEVEVQEDKMWERNRLTREIIKKCNLRKD